MFKAKLCAHLFLHSEIKGIWLNCESIKYEKKKKGDDCDGNEIHQNFSCTFCLQGSQSEPGVSLETYRSPPSPACNYFVQGILHPPHLPSLLISTRQWTVHRRRNCSLKIFALANNNRFKAHLQEITNSQFNSHKQFSHRGFVDGSQRDFLPELCCVLCCICNILNVKLKCIFEMRWNGNFMFLNKTHNVLS